LRKNSQKEQKNIMGGYLSIFLKKYCVNREFVIASKLNPIQLVNLKELRYDYTNYFKKVGACRWRPLFRHKIHFVFILSDVAYLKVM